MKRGILILILSLVLMSSIVSAGLFSGVWSEFLTGNIVNLGDNTYQLRAGEGVTVEGVKVSLTKTPIKPTSISFIVTVGESQIKNQVGLGKTVRFGGRNINYIKGNNCRKSLLSSVITCASATVKITKVDAGIPILPATPPSQEIPCNNIIYHPGNNPNNPTKESRVKFCLTNGLSLAGVYLENGVYNWYGACVATENELSAYPYGSNLKDCATTTTETRGCTDSDGGININIIGTIVDPDDVGTGIFRATDKCLLNNQILEYSCLNDAWYANYLSCPNGCSNGACISSDVILTTGMVKEQVKCAFNNPTINSKYECYSSVGVGCTAGPINYESPNIACVADVSGEKGASLIWKSTCGGYAYTTMDGVSEYAEFSCASTEPIPPTQIATMTDVLVTLSPNEAVIVGRGDKAKQITLYDISSTGSIAIEAGVIKEVIATKNTKTINGIEITNEGVFYNSADKTKSLAKLLITFPV